MVKQHIDTCSDRHYGDSSRFTAPLQPPQTGTVVRHIAKKTFDYVLRSIWRWLAKDFSWFSFQRRGILPC